MALPLDVNASEPGHVGDHEEMHAILADIVASVFTKAARYGQGLAADRPAASRLGSFYFATDTGRLSFDTGSAWRDIVADSATALVVDTVADTVSGFKAPSCRVGRATDRTISTGVWSSGIGWDDESGGNLWDNDALHSIVSNTDRFTATRDGYWLVGCHIRWATNAVGQRALRLKKFPADDILQTEDKLATVGADYMHIVDLVELELGEYIEWEVYQTSGGNLDIQASQSHAWMAFHGDE